MKKVYDEELKCSFMTNDCVADCLYYIWAIGHDYDGYGTVNGLKSLVDELVDYANDARKFLDEGKYYSKECPAPKPKNNYDRIKSMSVDEMGEFLSDIYFQGFTDRVTNKVEPHKYTVEWLEEEV